MSETALVKLEERFPILSEPAMAEFRDLMLDEIGAAGMQLSLGDLERIRVPSGGGGTWEIPAMDGDEVEAVSKLTGVVIHTQPGRRYYSKPFEENDGAPPECSSADGLRGLGSPGGDCLSCPLAQFGTAAKGKGQACSQRLLVFILLEGRRLPAVIDLPPSSLRWFRAYRLQLLNRKGLALTSVLTSLRLKPEKNADQVKFSRLAPSCEQVLAAEAARGFAAYAEMIRPHLEKIAERLVREPDLDGQEHAAA